MEYQDLLFFLQHVGTDPSRLIFEDELTGIYNRRFLHNYFRYKVSWDSLEIHPVSLIMMDLDHFKQVNDTYGHGIGDQVLIWLASLLKEMSGDKGLAIRYAGDEFMILMPHTDKDAALQLGQNLIQRLHKESLHLPEMEGELHITLSVGVATAPEDARTGKALIQKADTALYFAKKTGRDRLVNAGQVAPEDVFAKTALQLLDLATIAGRKTQLGKIAEALKKFSKRQSQFIVVEGADGMGKSEFLQTIRRNLAQAKIWQIAVQGITQEAFRPYYLISNILVEILNQRADKGSEILDSLTPQEINYLSHILPQLGEPEEAAHQEDEKSQREQIFATLVHFFPQLINSRPVILLIDDLHLSDEATLLLLRRLILRGDVPLFICGTTTDMRPDKVQVKPAPVERFFLAFKEELDIGRVPLTPLSGADIATHFQGIFPQVRLPENFGKDLAQLTQGNPLFISEIQRKLVLDRKITLTGQQWKVEPLEEGYLPRSLEEIVSQKIAALNEESRQLLDQASTIGENVSLSVLTGTSESRETEVLEFVDQAVAQGLISSDYQINDEAIRFLSKRVLDITYGAIQEDRKQELHERVGNYQESLHAQRLLPSAATLAYHFQLSANQEKARLYREALQSHNTKIFNAEEAVDYTGEKAADGTPEDSPLDPASLSHVPGVIRALLTTVRNIKLYPPGSKAIVSSTQQLKENIGEILAGNDRINISIVESGLMVNGEELDVTEFKSIAVTFVKFLSRLELRGIAFSQGLSEHELTMMLEGLGRISKKMIDRRFWQRFSAEQRLLHIELKQVRYTTVAEPDETIEDKEIPEQDLRPASGHDAAHLLSVDQGLDEQDLTQVPQVLRCLLTAASNIKLYPPESTAITTAIEQFHQALKEMFIRRPAVTLARVGESLLVNGHKIDTTDFKAMADGFVRFLESIELRSLSFLKNTSVRELALFIGALALNPPDDFDNTFWRRFATDQKLSGILFDQRLYGILEEVAGLGLGQGEPIADEGLEPGEASLDAEVDLTSQIAGEREFAPEPVPVEDRAVQLTEASIESKTEHLNDLLLKGDENESRQIINQLFEDFAEQVPQIRTKLISGCDTLLEDPVLGSQPRLVELLTDPFLVVLPQEEDPGILREMAALLSNSAANLIQFGDYQRASRILKHLRNRQKQQHESGDEQTLASEIIFTQELEPRTQMVLLEDLRSKEPTQLQRVTQLLSSLGPVAMPLLIEVVKREDNLRVRQIASHLLKELGPEAAKLLRRELVLEGFAKERVRILEVIDGVTQDLKTELAYALGDENAKVRRTAFHLIERLNKPEVTMLLFDYASHEDSTRAVVAIKTLGKLKPPGTVDVLVSLLDHSKETERLIACCRALGQIGDPAAIGPLAKMIAPGGILALRKKRSSLVRATAAFALAQIPDPQVAEVLASYTEDRDPRVRQVAQTQANKSLPPSPTQDN
jgi:diguanylate cyclase (GGDEF)-like protein